MSTPGRRWPIQVFDSERIVPWGRAKVTWLYRRGSGWTRVAEHPEATLERLDPGPGTVWETACTLLLEPGARLLRVESRPTPPSRQRPLDYLLKEQRQVARRVARVEYAVGRRGELEPVRREPEPPPGGRAGQRSG